MCAVFEGRRSKYINHGVRPPAIGKAANSEITLGVKVVFIPIWQRCFFQDRDPQNFFRYPILPMSFSSSVQLFIGIGLMKRCKK